MANFLIKAFRGLLPKQTTSEPRAPISGYVPGVTQQPYPEQVDPTLGASGLISRDRMREIVTRTPTAAACLNAILDFAGGVPMNVRNIDPAVKMNTVQAKKIRKVLTRPNPDQTRRQFLLSLMRDIVTFGYGAVEIVPTGRPDNPVDLWVMDSARLWIDFDEHGYVRGYDMLDVHGQLVPPKGKRESVPYQMGEDSPEHGWEPNEVIFFSLNPVSESVYPRSRIVQLFTAAVLEDLMVQFISERFTDSNIPFGIFDLGDVSEQELKMAVDNWNAQANVGNRILMTGSRGAGSKWIPFGYHLKDLEATQLLQEFRMKIMGIMGVTMQELGESQDVSKSNGYNLSFTFKKRAIQPLLDEITETLTRRLLWDTLGYTDAELYYDDIDSRDELLSSQIDTNYQKLGIMSPNEIRNRKGLVSVQGGDEPLVFTGNSWIPLSMVHKMAQQILDIEAQTTSLGTQGAAGIKVRENLSNARGPTEIGKPAGTNGHNRGATSELSRQLAGKSKREQRNVFRLLLGEEMLDE